MWEFPKKGCNANVLVSFLMFAEKMEDMKNLDDMPGSAVDLANQDKVRSHSERNGRQRAEVVYNKI
jgi:hypothetical protein